MKKLSVNTIMRSPIYFEDLGILEADSCLTELPNGKTTAGIRIKVIAQEDDYDIVMSREELLEAVRIANKNEIY